MNSGTTQSELVNISVHIYGTETWGSLLTGRNWLNAVSVGFALNFIKMIFGCAWN